MEGIIILFIIISIVQSIIEKAKKQRQKNDTVYDKEAITQTEYSANDKVNSYYKHNNEQLYMNNNSKKAENHKPNKTSRLNQPNILDESIGEVGAVNDIDYNTNLKINMNKENIRQGILLKEILGPPKSSIYQINRKRNIQRTNL